MFAYTLDGWHWNCAIFHSFPVPLPPPLRSHFCKCSSLASSFPLRPHLPPPPPRFPPPLPSPPAASPPSPSTPLSAIVPSVTSARAVAGVSAPVSKELGEVWQEQWEGPRCRHTPRGRPSPARSASMVKFIVQNSFPHLLLNPKFQLKSPPIPPQNSSSPVPTRVSFRLPRPSAVPLVVLQLFLSLLLLAVRCFAPP